MTSQTEVGMPAEQSLKPQAAGQVAADIQPHTIVGLGHVSTAMLEVRGLAEQLSCGELADIQRIPCSRVTEAKARRLDIPRITPEDHSVIDLTAEGIRYLEQEGTWPPWPLWLNAQPPGRTRVVVVQGEKDAWTC